MGAGCRVETMNGSAQVPDVQEAILHDGRSHHAADLTRRPQATALSDVSLTVGTDRIYKGWAAPVPGRLPHGHEDSSVGCDWRRGDRAARENTGAGKPSRIF